MKAQFAHVSTFARKPSSSGGGKWSATDIAGEASRNPDHSGHVKTPLPPVHLVGFPVAELPQRLEDYLGQHKAQVKLKNGKIAERKIREDQHVLTASVYSWPEATEFHDKEKAKAFFEDCIKFHAKTLGEVQCAVMHLDEDFPHIHIYSFHTNARAEHPGWKAKNGVALAGGESKEQTAAYKKAMEQFQDQFHSDVGIKHGLDRLGPKRQRLSRGEWKERKAELAKTADALRKIGPVTEQLEKVREIGRVTSRDVQKAMAELEKKQKTLETLNEKIMAENSKLAELQVKVQSLEKKLSVVRQAGGVVNLLRQAFYGVLKKELPEVQKVKLELQNATTKQQKIAGELKEIKQDKAVLQDAYGQAIKRESALETQVKIRDEMLDKMEEKLHAKAQPQPQPTPQPFRSTKSPGL